MAKADKNADISPEHPWPLLKESKIHMVLDICSNCYTYTLSLPTKKFNPTKESVCKHLFNWSHDFLMDLPTELS